MRKLAAADTGQDRGQIGDRGCVLALRRVAGVGRVSAMSGQIMDASIYCAAWARR
jgi:hypothetical protein